MYFGTFSIANKKTNHICDWSLGNVFIIEGF